MGEEPMVRLMDAAWLLGLWAAPAAAALYVLASARRRTALRQFVGPVLTGALAGGVSGARRWVKAGLVAASLGLVVLALARPAWNPRAQPVTSTGRDVVFLLDVSRSMLAEDLRPNRLEHAKLLIRDVLDAARGDRIGIIAFAGSAVVKCPLTTDYAFARLVLDSITPDSVSRGGTLIGDAIRTALEQVFEPGDKEGAEDRYRDIILITDGEDHDSFPIPAAQEAGKRGVRIVAIGLGSELEGAPVPAADAKEGGRYMTYEGKTVLSRMDPDSLRKVAAASREGVCLNVGTGNIRMDEVYARLMASANKRRLESVRAVRYDEGFQAVLAAALGLLLTEMLIGERRART